MIKINEITENNYFIESAEGHWTCGLDDKDVKLGLYLEAINMYEATGEKQYKSYPWLFSFSILPSNPHKRFNTEGHTSRLSRIFECNSYQGGVPVDHKLLDLDNSNKHLMDNLSAKNAMIHETKPEFGTIAAQKGKGTSFEYPSFKTEDAAYEFAVDLATHYADLLMGIMIGFTLDGPINMAGETGWDTIKNAVSRK